MPNGFMPSNREHVLDRVQEMETVFGASPVGEGVAIILHREHNNVLDFTDLTEGSGWYVDMIEPREGGDLLVLMPIRRVPE